MSCFVPLILLVSKECSCPCVSSLAARVMWRIHKDTGVASDSQLLSVEELEDHVADLSEDHLKRIDADVHAFLQYWSCGRTKHSLDEIAHIFGIVRTSRRIT